MEHTRLPILVLDHGYVKLIDSWGGDERVIEAARMSTGKGFQGWGPIEKGCTLCDHEGMVSCPSNSFAPSGQKRCPTCGGTKIQRVEGDEKLLRFLWENQHHTPFEMGGMTIEVAAPLFVFREWHRHRVPFSYNEMSARYIAIPNEHYKPNPDVIMNRIEEAAAGRNKQAQGTGAIPDRGQVLEWLRRLNDLYHETDRHYQAGLTLGIPKEIARVIMPVGRYSRMRASSNLRGWLHFLALRNAPNAQWEIRRYAQAVAVLIEELFPRSYSLFKEGRKS